MEVESSLVLRMGSEALTLEMGIGKSDGGGQSRLTSEKVFKALRIAAAPQQEGWGHELCGSQLRLTLESSLEGPRITTPRRREDWGPRILVCSLTLHPSSSAAVRTHFQILLA